jgi:hypothetical protein
MFARDELRNAAAIVASAEPEILLLLCNIHFIKCSKINILGDYIQFGNWLQLALLGMDRVAIGSEWVALGVNWLGMGRDRHSLGSPVAARRAARASSRYNTIRCCI